MPYAMPKHINLKMEHKIFCINFTFFLQTGASVETDDKANKFEVVIWLTGWLAKYAWGLSGCCPENREA